ncbi:MAG TPA: methyltransferase [Syntrophus sp. (in: bacteria)]|nr:methyltransferase [Syntrophus sp. (in: bacteria)]
MTTENQSIACAAGTGSSVVVDRCQICDYPDLESILFLGYLPPVNRMSLIGEKPHEQSSYPAQFMYCPRCHLVQLGLIVDPQVLFPSEYPYTSSTTKILRENFAELYSECTTIIGLKKDDLVVDIGSNDGNLLSNFKDHHRVLGITPEEIGRIAIERGIPTIIDYFSGKSVSRVLAEYGKAKLVTATNVFAHIEKVNNIVDLIMEILQPGGVFISESHYLLPLIETLQYDTIYHEHLRYYSLHSIQYLLEMHGLEIFHAKRIPTHGGSVRVYAARKGDYPISQTVAALLAEEAPVVLDKKNLLEFKKRVIISKLRLQKMLLEIKEKGGRIYGISAPSRASTLINYVGLDDGIIDYVLEIQGSHKIGKYVPGTIIPVLEESRLFEDQPEYALLFSWHIADELVPKLKQKGFKGKFICPLPEPHILE